MSQLSYDPEQIIKVFKLVGKNGYSPQVGDTHIKCLCPFPHYKNGVKTQERNPSFGINYFTGQYNCFSCGSKGGSLQLLADRLGVDLPQLFRTDEIKYEKPELIPLADIEREFLIKNKDIAEKYLIYRGFDSFSAGVLVRKYDIGASKDKEQIYFNVKDDSGNIFAYIERNTKLSTPKEYRWFIHPKGIDKSDILYGYYEADKEGDKTCYLVESPIDVLVLYAVGIDTALATCGTTIFNKHVEKILIHYDTAVLIPHNDEAGGSWMYNILDKFEGRIRTLGVRLPDGVKDIGELAGNRLQAEEVISKKKYLNYTKKR